MSITKINLRGVHTQARIQNHMYTNQLQAPPITLISAGKGRFCRILLSYCGIHLNVSSHLVGSTPNTCSCCWKLILFISAVLASSLVRSEIRAVKFLPLTIKATVKTTTITQIDYFYNACKVNLQEFQLNY